MPTIKEVAEYAGVSIATVSYVINGTKNVSPKTEQRVHEAIKALNYRVNHFASNMKGGKSGSIAFLAADLSNPFFHEVAISLERTLRAEKYNLILANGDEKINVEKSQVDNLVNHAIDGLIITSSTSNHTYITKLVPQKIPVVFFDRTPMGIEKDCVLSDNVAGATSAVDYLVSLGHRRIGLISGIPMLSSSKEREQGYKNVLQSHGIPLDPTLMLNGDGRRHSGYQLMQQLHDTTGITAVFITNNAMALGALTFLHDNGVRIPEDMSIVIFDDYEWSTVHAPALTAVKQNTMELGRTAGEVILRRLNETSSPAPVHEYRIPTELIKRESCSPVNN